jgi:hypothetical protein
MLERWIPTARAAFVAVFIFANLTFALPAPSLTWEGVMSPSYGQVELNRWWAWWGNILPVSRFTADYWFRRWAYYQTKTVGVLRAPFSPFLDELYVSQRWMLFAKVGSATDALVIEVRRGDHWSVLYRRLDPVYDWHEAQLRYRRIRGVWHAEPHRGAYERLGRWIAKDVAREMPDVEEVRILIERRFQTRPDQEPNPFVERRETRVYRTSELRP